LTSHKRREVTAIQVWPSDRIVAFMSYSTFSRFYDDLWFPSRDDLWVADRTFKWMLELSHEEVLSFFEAVN
jgi:hypothetical protein